MSKDYSDRDQHNTHGEVISFPEPAPRDEKFLVLKREDIPKLVAELRKYLTPEFVKTIEHYAVGDAVVIRRQDYTAAPVLAVYADVVGVFIKLGKENGTLDDDALDSLLATGDYMHQQAIAAAEEGRKLPD